MLPALLRPRAVAPLALMCLAAAAPPALAQDFVPVAVPAMASHVSFATGAAWVDFDGDGDLDLFVLTAFGADRDNVLYRNDGGDTFVRVTGVPIVQDGAQTVCSTWADFDNDGAIDAYVSGLDTNHGLLYQGYPGFPPAENAATLLSGAAVKGAGCAWGDYDNDGHVDLVVSVLAGALGMSGGNRLFHNLGDGTFEAVTGVHPTTITEFHHHPTWADWDGDGDLDLCFAAGAVGSTGPDYFYRNELAETGFATFALVTTGVLATDARDSQTLSFADFDNDGDLDCYAINYTSVPNQLYRNDGGSFTKLTTGAIVTDMGSAHGVAWGDYDNDADLDVYVARDNAQADRYYRNEGGGAFTSLTTLAPVTPLRSQYGVAAGDYDGDGDLDLFLPTARSEGPSVLYRNDLASGAHWLEVACVGSPANRSAIGAKVRVKAVVGGIPRWQMREIAASSGYGSQGPLAAHFGLGDATAVDSIVVEWPGGGSDHLLAIPADTAITIVQGHDQVGVGAAAARTAGAVLVAPHPVTSGADVRFGLAEPEWARVTVHDLQGREIARLADGHFAAGPQRLALGPDDLPAAGVYLLRVATARGVSVRRLVHLR